MDLKRLSEILQLDFIQGGAPCDVLRVHANSKTIRSGDLFFPRKGDRFDGLNFIDEAMANGAVAVVVPKHVHKQVGQIIAEPTQGLLRKLCQCLYQEATLGLDLIGVTGTNGKTSVCHFIEALFNNSGLRAGYIGTTAYRWMGKEVPAKLTTPMYEDLQYYTHHMKQDDVQSVVMECSSHGIALGRIDDLHFDVCVFTNLTHEHLDFHENMESYGSTKSELFRTYLKKSKKKNKLAVINIDDELGRGWVNQNIFEKIWTFGFDHRADIYPTSHTTTPKGMDVTLSVFGKNHPFHMPMLGMYNVSNMMAAIAVGLWKGISMDRMTQVIESGIHVPGRLQKVDIQAPFSVIVDFAYTEDALKNVLGALRPFCKKRMIVVFGCGGDRDATRRPKMAKAVYDLADMAIVTTDNPRSEDPDVVIDEMLIGIEKEAQYKEKVIRKTDRRKAIECALNMAKPDDVIVIAGKGHEIYQEIKGVRYPFNDQEVVQTYWSSK